MPPKELKAAQEAISRAMSYICSAEGRITGSAETQVESEDYQNRWPARSGAGPCRIRGEMNPCKARTAKQRNPILQVMQRLLQGAFFRKQPCGLVAGTADYGEVKAPYRLVHTTSTLTCSQMAMRKGKSQGDVKPTAEW